MKHKNHQQKEDEVANLLNTWMSEIPVNLEKNRQHLLFKMPWRRKSPRSVKWLAQAQGGRSCCDIEKAIVLTGGSNRYYGAVWIAA
jgi:hypothetical protein